MKKVTMQQIADHLGVSKFVVSKALSGKGGVNEMTKERVIQAASQLGYFNQKNGYVKNVRPSAGTSAVIPPGKQSVLVLMPNIRSQNKESLYWGKVLAGISDELEEQNLGMIIISEPRTEVMMNIINPEGILGIIGVGQIATNLLLEVHRTGLPMVLVDHEDNLIPADSIFANNVDGTYRMVNHLIGLGHRQLHFLGNLSFSRSFRDRWIGFRSALEENGLDVQLNNDPMLYLDSVETGGFAVALKEWLQHRKQSKPAAMPTALVCANDSIAMNTIGILKELDFRVPEEITVTGFDNIDDAARFEPAITTVNVPKEQLGRRAVTKLLDRLADSNRAVEKWLISVELLYRQSASKPGAAAHASI